MHWKKEKRCLLPETLARSSAAFKTRDFNQLSAKTAAFLSKFPFKSSSFPSTIPSIKAHKISIKACKYFINQTKSQIPQMFHLENDFRADRLRKQKQKSTFPPLNQPFRVSL
jgi:hypothetical protein